MRRGWGSGRLGGVGWGGVGWVWAGGEWGGVLGVVCWTFGGGRELVVGVEATVVAGGGERRCGRVVGRGSCFPLMRMSARSYTGLFLVNDTPSRGRRYLALLAVFTEYFSKQ